MIVNAPLRGGVNIDTWGLSLVTKICNGGTWTRDPLNFATEAQLIALAALGKDVVYSVCLARTPDKELDEINRYISYGVNIVAVRFGNEESQYEVAGVGEVVNYELGRIRGAAYVARVQEYVDKFPTYPRIYAGEFPSNMQNPVVALFRAGWNKGISENIRPEDVIDLHVYQNINKQEQDLSYFAINPPLPNGFIIIESGIPSQSIEVVGNPTQTQDNIDNFIPKTIAHWERLRLSLRENDEFGVQLMEQTTNSNPTIGLVFGGELTELGVWVNNLYYSGEEEYDPENPNEPIEPTDPPVTIVRIPLRFVSWFSGIYSYALYNLSDGRTNVFARFFKSEAPSVGDEWPK